MSEWWTYRLSSLLLFSPRTYYRLFELYNADVWPGHLIALGLGLALLALAMQRRRWAAGAVCAGLAACWWWVAWAFHLQRYAGINWAATWFAGAFAIEGFLLLACAGLGAGWRIATWSSGNAKVGLGLLIFAILIQPWLGLLWGRPWFQAEVFGLAPDPTALGTLGLLLLLRKVDDNGRPGPRPAMAWLPWPIPLLWCGVSAATLWAMQAPDAWLMPAAALLAAWRAGTPPGRG
jgi:hypothetical protein